MTGSKNIEKLVEYYNEKKIAHAYLISTNNITKCLEVLLNVIKNIFCDSDYKPNCNKCSLCHLVDINNLPSLKIITPDGNFIKKEQIIELKNSFSKSNQYTNESIYIILNAEKMNKESANTMLKFLEEPEGDIIGFFITSEKDNMMLTIQSRCQLIDAYFDDMSYEKYGIDKETYDNYYTNSLNYLKKLELEKSKLILYNKDFFCETEKNDITIYLKIILNIYQTEIENRILKKKDNCLDFLKHLTNNNIYAKIKLIIKLLNELNYNINLDLFLDKMVIEMDGINNESI